jgi:hypothetical protein
MQQELVTDLTILLPAVLLTLALTILSWRDSYLSRVHRRMLQIVSLLVFCLIAQNYIENLLATRLESHFWRTFVSVVGYSVRPMILVVFCKIVAPERPLKIAWALTGINTAVYLTAFFSPVTIWFNENGRNFQAGPLKSVCFHVSLILLIYLLYLTYRMIRKRGLRESWLPFLIVIMIIASVYLDSDVGGSEQPITFLTLAIVLSCIFFYIWLHLQFVRAHEQEILDGQRIQIMLSQIKPHFLYNSLEAIRRLYRKDPLQAEEALLEFERYLRGNMESLTQESMIPFMTELEHTRLYLKMEQLRFPDELRIVYDLEAKDFLIPPLTLEPLAENAVRHGIREKTSGEGTVTISTREYPDRWEIQVADDGPGFDPNAAVDEKKHIGLHNVRERLRYAGATLRLESPPEGGTRATILIPRTAEEQKRRE